MRMPHAAALLWCCCLAVTTPHPSKPVLCDSTRTLHTIKLIPDFFNSKGPSKSVNTSEAYGAAVQAAILSG